MHRIVSAKCHSVPHSGVTTRGRILSDGRPLHKPETCHKTLKPKSKPYAFGVELAWQDQGQCDNQGHELYPIHGGP
jgi:hypothetical protein